jgi:hypothetical protein
MSPLAFRATLSSVEPTVAGGLHQVESQRARKQSAPQCSAHCGSRQPDSSLHESELGRSSALPAQEACTKYSVLVGVKLSEKEPFALTGTLGCVIVGSVTGGGAVVEPVVGAGVVGDSVAGA